MHVPGSRKKRAGSPCSRALTDEEGGGEVPGRQRGNIRVAMCLSVVLYGPGRTAEIPAGVHSRVEVKLEG
jgi:hypothetical protein